MATWTGANHRASLQAASTRAGRLGRKAQRVDGDRGVGQRGDGTHRGAAQPGGQGLPDPQDDLRLVLVLRDQALGEQQVRQVQLEDLLGQRSAHGLRYYVPHRSTLAVTVPW